MGDIDEFIGNNRGVKIDYCRISNKRPKEVKLSWIKVKNGEDVRMNRFFNTFDELINFLKGVKNED